MMAERTRGTGEEPLFARVAEMRSRFNRRRLGVAAGMSVKEAVLGDGDVVQKFIILLADSDGREPIRGRTKLQKMMFMASRTAGELGGQAGFEPGSSGPHSKAVDGELEYLSSIGVLDDGGAGIAVAPAGRPIARELAGTADANTITMLRSTKRLLNDLPAREALGYVCTAYPEMASESAEYEGIKPQIESILLSLIRKEKISSGHAAELLGKPIHHVIGLMKEAGIAHLH